MKTWFRGGYKRLSRAEREFLIVVAVFTALSVALAVGLLELAR